MHGLHLRGRVVAALAVSALLLAPPARVTHAAPLVQLYQITDLGTLGGPLSNGNAVNIRGQVTGYSLDAAGDFHAFLWQNGVMRDLGTLAGGSPGFNSFGVDINAEGDVTGPSDTLTSSDAFLDRNGVMTDLGALGGSGSAGSAINVFDQVVGGASLNVDDPANPGNQEFHAFLWQRGTMSDLGTLGTGTDSEALGINDLGQVAGWSNINTGFDSEAFGPDYHAFLSQRGAMTDLGTLPGGNYSQANGINEFGQAAGFSETGIVDPSDAACGNPTSFHAIQAALWQRGTVIDLPPFPGDPDSLAFGLNDWGQVVGRSGTACAVTGAALWQHGTVTDLNTVIPANAGWFLQRARAINDGGQITGQGISPNGDTHAFLLTPAGFGLPHAVDQQAETRAAQAAQARYAPGGSDFRHGRPVHGKPPQ